ncbi:phosphotransferase family protein [Candidatus Latescibacterota bacterium]
MHVEAGARVVEWLRRCISSPCDVRTTVCLKDAAGREVWDASCRIAGHYQRAVLTVLKTCDPDAVNTSLGPSDTADKCRMAMSELHTHGIPTPAVVGYSADSGEAALLSSWIESTSWTAESRIAAAKALGRLHSLEAEQLSPALQSLLQVSDPREYRTTGGEAPPSGMQTLVHGDFFWKNLLPTDADGSICVIDWETFGWGDPMWDLGFLLGADRNVSAREADLVIATYGRLRPIDYDCLQWHRDRWRGMRDASSRAPADS